MSLCKRIKKINPANSFYCIIAYNVHASSKILLIQLSKKLIRYFVDFQFLSLFFKFVFQTFINIISIFSDKMF